MKTLLWFQRDLRTQDNPCLQWALQKGQPVIAVYIYSPDEDAPWSEGSASRWWLHHSLQKLSAQLAEFNIKLHFFKANSRDVLNGLFKTGEFSDIAWGNRIEPYRRKYETQIEKLAQDNGIQVKRFNHDLLKTPANFLTASQQTPYKVFTPFYKKLRYELDLNSVTNLQHRQCSPCSHFDSSPLQNSCALQELSLLDKHAWHEKLHRYWNPGETSALNQLDHFIETALNQYTEQRDFPALDGTSNLSPHLHFGEISPAQIVQQIMPLILDSSNKNYTEAESFLRQLIWREFARYILWHFPQTIDQPMNRKFNAGFWHADNALLKTWQQGKTGIKIVDAGMKQLWETGSMHNRVRMLAASLLTKNMGASWQQGARWFWDTLVDADLANNSMGWQWVAGCGVDAAPYFRIFNPETQASKFDKQNSYTDKWLKEKNTVNEPIIDISSSRKQALERYNTYIRHSV
ncbi:MAG: DNA photolyase family protein [Gammaproteobacteria bacterium]|nr:DNA photolyase family protein [Gammaproteobacteria bacterium]